MDFVLNNLDSVHLATFSELKVPSLSKCKQVGSSDFRSRTYNFPTATERSNSKVCMRLRRKWESPVSDSANKPALFIHKRKVDLLSQLIGN